MLISFFAMTHVEVYIYISIMVSLAVFLLLILFVILELKMTRIMRKLDDISDSASQFVKMGMKYFKGRKD